MRIYTWFYPDAVQLARPEYVADIVARLKRLRATGLYCMADEGDVLRNTAPWRAFVARCHDEGLDCQLGFLPFSEPPDPTPEMLRRRYTYLQDGELKYRGLCPAWPENRMLAAHRATQLLDALQPPALHLDFMRYYFANNPIFGVNLEWEDGRKWLDTYFHCDCPLCQTERLELLGREATTYDRQHPAFIFKRIQQRGQHVEEVLRALRRLTTQHDMRLTVAVRVQVFNRALIEGQDWPRWCEEGLVDAVSPMNYATDLATVEHRFQENQRLLRQTRVEVLEGLARRSSAGGNTPEQLLAQAQRVVELGADGVALFHLGVLDEEDFRLWEAL
ncbi:hypothetical protein LLH23_06455 [bacterium]|nr:hypothetical protein [bacterium]